MVWFATFTLVEAWSLPLEVERVAERGGGYCWGVGWVDGGNGSSISLEFYLELQLRYLGIKLTRNK